MSSELLGSAQNVLKGNLGGAWDITNGYQDAYTDLGIARRFGAAAAAYSLRDIGAMNGRVVKVRRDSDDEEEDFSANQVSSGALEDWVNGKLESTLPADVAPAAAAYSLRKVKENYTGPVVRIRRSSDNTEGDFTEQELEDGTATNFIDGGESLLYGICGQSNAAGQAENSFAGDRFDELDALSNRVFMWDTTTTSFVEYDFGVNQQKSSDSPVTEFGPESELLRLAAEANPTKKIYVVKYAISGSSLFQYWAPGDTYYNTFKDAYLNAVSAIQASNENIIHKGVLFAQGEKDAQGELGGGAQNYYESYQRSFIETLRTDLSLPNLPIVLTLPSVRTTEVSNHPQIDIVSQAKVNVAASLEFVSTIDSSNFGMKTDDLHYNADGQIEQGTQFYNQANGIETSTGTGDGYVRTWYDQAGSNDAVQATAANQPKIAENGALLDGINFNANTDGTSPDFLQVATRLGVTTDHFISAVFNGYQTDSSSFGAIINTRNGNAGYQYGIANTDKVQAFFYAGAGNNANSSSNFVLSNDSPKRLVTFDKDGNNLTGFGNATTNGISLSNGILTPSTTVTNIGVGGNVGTTTSLGLRANINELIVYETDQADNRFKIESNINNYYGLYTFQGDGFVETWYDQSGNGNDATQGTASKQPKIVSNGGLSPDGLEFDGSDDTLVSTSFSATQPITSLAVFKSSNTSDSQTVVGGVSYNFIIHRAGGAATAGLNAGTLYAPFSSITTKQLMTTLASGTSSRVAQNGNLSSTGNAGTNDWTQLGIGSNGNGGTAGSGSAKFDGTIEEVIVFDADKISDITEIEREIANHYNITLS